MLDCLQQLNQPVPTAALIIALCAILLLRTYPADRRKLRGTLTLAAIGFIAWFSLDYFAQNVMRTPFGSLLLELAMILLVLSGVRIGVQFLFRILLRRFGFARILEDIFFALALLAWLLFRLRMGGMDLSGIVTTSAVVTAAVVFSLQETLGNLFGGLALQLDTSCGVGNWVLIDDKVAQIVGIRWRYTSMANPAGETFLIPNGYLIKNRVVVVAHHGEQVVPWRRDIYFNVDYKVPPAHVIRTVDAAIQASMIENVASEPRPHCLLVDISGSTARYCTRAWIVNPGKDQSTQSAVRVHVLAALARAEILPAIPEQSVHLIQQDERHYTMQREREIDQRCAALRHIELFAALDKDELRTLAQATHVAPFAAGDMITRQGSAAQCLFVLAEGAVEVFAEGEGGTRRSLARLAAPAYFGEMGLMTGAPRTATVVAHNDVVCYRVDKEAFETILHARPEIGEHISHTLAARQIANERTLASHEAVAATRTRAQELLGSIRSFFGLSH